MSKSSKEEHVWNNEEPQPIAVPLLGHHVQDSVSRNQQRDYDFVGRDPLIKELVTILNETRHTKGCYLISGYRGTGKTTLINKAIDRYARGSTGPAWLPTEETDGNVKYPRGIDDLLRRGHRKLVACSNAWPLTPLQRCWNQITFCLSRKPSLSTIYNYVAGRVIIVRVNLGQDQSLTSKDVLMSTASLLYQQYRYKHRFSKLVYFVVVVLPAAWISAWYFGEWLTKLPSYLALYEWIKQLTLIDMGYTWNNRLFFVLSIAGAAYVVGACLNRPTNARILRLLKHLNKRMVDTIEVEHGLKSKGFSSRQKITQIPLDARQIEAELLFILKECRRIPRYLSRPDIVFVFDELDKISHWPKGDSSNQTTHASIGRDLHERKKKVDDLLGTLKNFITQGKARFFFIAGREMLDSYQAERGSTSSLYESLFNRVFEVPSLLTDPSDHNQKRMHSLLEVYLCRKLMDPDVAIYLWLQYTNRNRKDDPCWEQDLLRKLMYSPFCLRTYYHYLTFVPGIGGVEARRIILGLRNFIQYLTIHSWGNPKRMESLFFHFTKSIESVDWRQNEYVESIRGPIKNDTLALQFGLLDQQRIVLASSLYTHLYHDLGRQLTSSGDKLAVSAMAAFQYILKFHRQPFSRYHLERMSETLSVYHAPELNTMIDSLVSKVLHQHIRRIRNSHYRYRFSGDFEQELRYISRVSDVESATYNFSLDAAAPIKAHYIDQLNAINDNVASGGESKLVMHELCVIIGDLFAQEQAYDEALTYYLRAVSILDGCDKMLRNRHIRSYVEALLRVGETYELRQRYDQAASVYLHARSEVKKLRNDPGREWGDALRNGDSKWDIFRQPFWAYWFLQLKRSPASTRDKLPLRFDYPFNNNEDRVNHYRAGQLAFFYGCHHTAVGRYLDAINFSGLNTGCTERTTYLGGYAYLHLGENLLVGMMRYRWDELNIASKSRKELNCPEYLSIEMQKTVCTAIKSLNGITSLTQLEEKFLPTSGSYLAQLSLISGENNFFEHIDVGKTLGMMAHAARLLAERGLHYHAAFAYLKILSIWGMFSEILFVLYGVMPHKDENVNLAVEALRQSEGWIAELRLEAEENISNLTMGGFGRFLARWTSRDVVPIKKRDSKTPEESPEDEFASNKYDDKWDEEIEPLLGKQEEIKKDFELTEDDVINLKLQHAIGKLFSDGMEQKEMDKIQKEVDKMVSEPIFHQRSMMGQKLIHLSAWEYMAKIRLRSDNKPFDITRNNIVPHSTRNMMFSHWLRGRRCMRWEVLDELQKLVPDNHPDKDRDQLKKIYDDSAAAVHNLHRAYYYIKQLSGNDQELMFPDPSMVLYDLWCLLYGLIEWERKVVECRLKMEVGDVPPGPPNKTFDLLVENVKDKLSSSNRRRENTPGNFYDFKNVTLRTIDALRDAENMGDLTNRVRSDAIKARHFLADDYEDPRFHLDWTLVQMYSPTAGILRRHVESATKILKGKNTTH